MVFLDKKFPVQQQSPYDLLCPFVWRLISWFFLVILQGDGISGHIGGKTTTWLGPLFPLSFYPSIIDNANVAFSLTSVACAVGPSVTMSSTDFSFQNQIFENLFEFSVAEIT